MYKSTKFIFVTGGVLSSLGKGLSAACIGALMNARGLMGLVVTNVGRDLGVIPDSVFCMLAIMSLATTVMTTPLLLNFIRHTEIEPFIRQSGFQRGRSLALCNEDTAKV